VHASANAGVAAIAAAAPRAQRRDIRSENNWLWIGIIVSPRPVFELLNILFYQAVDNAIKSRCGMSAPARSSTLACSLRVTSRHRPDKSQTGA
jgi:hypothetical protein